MVDIEWQCDPVPLTVVAQCALVALNTELQICLAIYCEGQLTVLHTQHIATVHPTAHTQQVQIPCDTMSKITNFYINRENYLF